MTYPSAYSPGRQSDRAPLGASVQPRDWRIDGNYQAAQQMLAARMQQSGLPRNVQTFGSVGSSWRCIGIALAPNGKLYCAPFGIESIVEIDPMTRTVSTFGSVAGSWRCHGIALAPNGKLYCSPLDIANTVEIGDLPPVPQDINLSRYLRSS